MLRLVVGLLNGDKLTLLNDRQKHDGSSVDLDFLQYLLEEEQRKEIETIIKKNEKKCLIGISNKNNRISLSMHDITQEILLEKYQFNKKESNHSKLTQTLIDKIQKRVREINRNNDKHELAQEKANILHYQKLCQLEANNFDLFDLVCEIADFLENALFDYKEKLKLLKKALKINENKSKETDLYDKIGNTLDDLGEYKKALEYKQKSFKINRSKEISSNN